jgi:predicted Zn-dependent protease
MGRTLTTDASGRVTLAAGSPLAIEAGGFLRRETLVPGGGPALTLWPLRADAGEGFVDQLVYSQLLSDGGLIRPTGPVTLTLSAELANDPVTRAAIERGADRVTAANGTVPFVVSDGPASGVVFSMRVDPGDPVLRDHPGYLAFTRVETLGHQIAGGSIVLRSRADALRTGLATHEIGHAFGLGHTTQPGLMMPLVGSFSDFSAAEQLVMRMMLQRAPGNRAPDSDAGIASSGARDTRIFACEG